MVVTCGSPARDREGGAGPLKNLKSLAPPAYPPRRSSSLPGLFGPPIVGKWRKRGENGTVCGA
nr:MAG TPA: hypothetical protein [Caudoviricetes sp.]